MSKQTKQSFVYGSTVLMLSVIIVKIVGAIFNIPLLNILGESGNGYFFSAYTFYSTVYTLTVTGLSNAVARMVSENVQRGRYRDVRRIFRLARWIFFIIGTIGTVLILLFAKGIARSVGNMNSYWSIVAVAPSIFFCCLMASYRGYYEGLSNMTPTAVTQVVEVFVKLIVGLLFANLIMSAGMKQYAATQTVFGTPCASEEAAQIASAPFGAAGAMLGVTFSTLSGLIFVFFRFKLHGDSITKTMLASAPEAKRGKVLVYRLLKVAIPITLSAAVMQISALIDTVTIQDRLIAAYHAAPGVFDAGYGSYLADTEEMHSFLFGIFSTCIHLFNLIPAFTNVFGKSALPNVTAAWTGKDRKLIKLNVESAIRMTTLVGAPMAFGMAFMARPVLQFLYPTRTGTIAIGGPLLAMLAVGAFFLAFVTPLNAIMQGIGRVDLPVKILLVGVLIKLLLNYTLVRIPSINIMGSAYSTIACYLVIAILSLWNLRKIITVPLNYMSILGKPVISGLICGFSAFLCYNALTNGKANSIITLCSIGVGALCYLLSLALLNAISPDDLRMLPKGEKIVRLFFKLHLIR